MIEEVKNADRFVLRIALFFSWLSLAQAQVSIDPAVSRVGTDIQAPSWHNPSGSSYHKSNPVDVLPSVKRQSTGKRYLDIHKQPGGKVGNCTRLLPYYDALEVKDK